MSWFSDLAGKAEDILNKIDQNAANVLKDKTIISDQLTDVIWHNSARRSSVEEVSAVSRSSSPATFTSSTPLRPAKSGQSNAPSPAPRSSPSRMLNLQKKDEDDDFFRFLNGQDTLNQPTENDELRRSPSGASVASAGSFSAVGGQDSQTESRTNSPSLGSSLIIHSKEEVEPGAAVAAVATATSLHNAATENFTAQRRRENTSEGSNRPQTTLFDENEMLRKEIRTLNSEVSLLLKRAKAAEEELASSSKKRASTDSLMSQLNTLRNNLREAEAQLAEAREENARLQQTSGKESKGHSDEEVEVLRDRIEKLITERDSHSEANQELALQVARLQETMAESTSQSERLRQQLTSALSETEQYRARATRILQEKEQIIASLQSRISRDDKESDSSQSSENVWEKQADQLRRERALDREEIAQLTESVRTLREELHDSERRFEDLREKGTKEVDRLQNRLAAERARRLAAEEDSKKYSEEIRSARNELTKERQSLNSRLRERDIEIAKLRSPISPMKNGNASSTPAELEGRVRQLATTLVQKQGALEAVLAERNALRLQLERAERQRAAPSPATPSTAVFVSGEDTGLRSRVPTLLVESPTDTGVTRRVKRAYSSLDTLGIRLGVFLRRYPLARIFVIIYVVVCHLWVLLVLLTYTPESQSSRPQSALLVANPKEPQA